MNCVLIEKKVTFPLISFAAVDFTFLPDAVDQLGWEFRGVVGGL